MNGVRILHVGKYASPDVGGIERFVFHLAEEQCRQGDVARVFAIGDKENAIYTTPSFASLCGVPLAWRSNIDLRETIADFKPDCVHVHMPTLLGLGLVRWWKGPLVVHWHADVLIDDSSFIYRMLYPLYAPYETSLLRRATVLIATSRAYVDSSTVLSQYPDRVVVVPLGIPIDAAPGPSLQSVVRLEQHSEGCQKHGTRMKSLWQLLGGATELKQQEIQNSGWRIDAHEQLVVAAGRHVNYKGFRHLIEAMKYTADSKCILMGAGPQTRMLKKITKQNGLVERIFFTGRVCDDVLEGIMRLADVCCIPSINRYEAFGMTGLEALHAGCWLAVADVKGSGLPLLATESGTGVTFEPRSAKAIAQSLLDLKYKQRAVNSRLECFSIANVAKQIMQKAYSRF